MTSWIVTLPRTVEWEDYCEELAAAAHGAELYFRVPPRVRSVRSGDRCYVTWRGFVRGWMLVRRVEWRMRSWMCDTTGRVWPPGVYIVRGGTWVDCAPVEYRGFQGVRRYEPAGEM